MGRPVWAGLCTWKELEGLTLNDLLDMHRSLNLKDHLEDASYRAINPEK